MSRKTATSARDFSYIGYKFQKPILIQADLKLTKSRHQQRKSISYIFVKIFMMHGNNFPFFSSKDASSFPKFFFIKLLA